MPENMSAEQFKAIASQAKSRRPGRGVRPDNNVMNGTEKAYAKHLEQMKASGQIHDWKFHAFTLTIAEPPNAKVARWTPDFAVWTSEMVLEFHEIKGFMQDHALVRIKSAAAQFPHPVIVVKRIAAKRGGGWERTEF
jgi:hypothetical protein